MIAVQRLQGCKRTVCQSAAVNNAPVLRSQADRPQESLLHHCESVTGGSLACAPPGDVPAARVPSAPECNSVWCDISWAKMVASSFPAGFYNHSWSGAKKGSCLWVNYFETSRQRLVLKSSITYLRWTAYKGQAGNGQGWAGFPVEHLEEFAYTSRMNRCSSCCNGKNTNHILWRRCFSEAHGQRESRARLQSRAITTNKTRGFIPQKRTKNPFNRVVIIQ